jgi:hypothetical protein
MFFIQCCESGSALIWLSGIRLGMRIQIQEQEKLQIKTDIQPFKRFKYDL